MYNLREKRCSQVSRNRAERVFLPRCAFPRRWRLDCDLGALVTRPIEQFFDETDSKRTYRPWRHVSSVRILYAVHLDARKADRVTCVRISEATSNSNEPNSRARWKARTQRVWLHSLAGKMSDLQQLAERSTRRRSLACARAAVLWQRTFGVVVDECILSSARGTSAEMSDWSSLPQSSCFRAFRRRSLRTLRELTRPEITWHIQQLPRAELAKRRAGAWEAIVLQKCLTPYWMNVISPTASFGGRVALRKLFACPGNILVLTVQMKTHAVHTRNKRCDWPDETALFNDAIIHRHRLNHVSTWLRRVKWAQQPTLRINNTLMHFF